MAKVYLLTTGTYSDFKVLGAFSSQEKLNEAVDPRTKEAHNPPYNVHVFELDSLPSQSFGPVYRVSIHLPSGEFRDGDDVYYCYRAPNGPSGVSWLAPWEHMPKEYSETVNVRSPISLEHAQKVAIEKRQEWLRTGAIETIEEYTPEPGPEKLFDTYHG